MEDKDALKNIKKSINSLEKIIFNDLRMGVQWIRYVRVAYGELKVASRKLEKEINKSK